MLRKTVSIPNVWAHIYIRYRHGRSREKISQALPPFFFRAGSKVIRVLIAWKEGEPGNEASLWCVYILMFVRVR